MTREELASRIAETSVLHGDFTLRSGRKSTWYIDKYRFSTQPDILEALGDMLAEQVTEGVTLLAGAELGGIPLVTAAAMAAGLPCVFIRNSRKEYGTEKQLEGACGKGDHALIVEDVATSGGQALEAAVIVQEQGATVAGIVAVVDRCEGAREHLEAKGIVFTSLFTAADLGIAETA